MAPLAGPLRRLLLKLEKGDLLLLVEVTEHHPKFAARLLAILLFNKLHPSLYSVDTPHATGLVKGETIPKMPKPRVRWSCRCCNDYMNDSSSPHCVESRSATRRVVLRDSDHTEIV